MAPPHPDDLVAALARPGLVVLAGPPGIGRSTLLAAAGTAFAGPVHAGGGLAALREVPALALARAVRVRLPGHDPALLAEAVRSRVGAGLLLLDDLHWADPATLEALPAIAGHCRVLAALRTPHRLDEFALRAIAHAWHDLAPLDAPTAAALARTTNPGLDPGAAARIAARAGGIPLAVVSLARTGDPDGPDLVEYAIAQALADLPRPARTALAALGLLGRPAPPGLLGPGEAQLRAAGLTTDVPDGVAPVSPYQAEVAAGVLDEPARRALHLRLAGLVGPAEAARHLAAAGESDRALAAARAAAAAAATGGELAAALLLVCEVGPASPADRLAAARAALSAGQPRLAVRVLGSTVDTEARVARADGYLLMGEIGAAEAELAALADHDEEAARVDLLCQLARGAVSEASVKRWDQTTHPGLRAALAAVRAATREPGWERDLAEAAAGDPLTARRSAWLLVEALAADGRLAEAASAAGAAAHACALDLAYSWQTRFLGAQLWCEALRGGGADEVVRRSAELLDRTLPEAAHGYLTAAAALAEADGGLLASARARLAAAAPGSAADWVARETAWLDGQPGLAVGPVDGSGLVAGLRRITAQWAALDAGIPAGEPEPVDAPDPVRLTLAAWSAGSGFAAAAEAWRNVAAREQVRCLLAHGLLAGDVTALLAAEKVATDAGLVVLLGRAHRALRRHGLRRSAPLTRSDTVLTERERDVLRLVARGEPTRRIAGQLGISRETVESHIRAGMRKLGAHTRTEAAARVLAELT